MATGEYITFVDSDDWIEPDMYKFLIEMIKKHGADIAICAVSTNDEKEEDYNETVLHKRKAMELLLNEKILSYPVNKVYKYDLFKDGLRFPIGMTFEDLYIMPHIFNNANKIILTNKKFYHYYYNRSGNISSSKNVYHSIDLSKACRHRYEFAVDFGIDNRNNILKKAVSTTIGAYGILPKSCSKESKIIKDFLKCNLKDILKNDLIDLARKLIAILIAYTDIYTLISRIRVHIRSMRYER